ncbi:MAG: hypothetical protein K2G83_04120 [Ruminococcus sp.]|nr:hypothetical protein [Ruminococcus sp.]
MENIPEKEETIKKKINNSGTESAVESVRIEPVKKVSETEPVQKSETEKKETFKYINPDSFGKPAETVSEVIQEQKPDIKIIGEVFGLYVIAEIDSNMIIVDKHAAHERIIFERLKSRNCKQYSQGLITEVKILLVSEEADIMENNVELLDDLGFVFDFSERPYITVKCIPSFIMHIDVEDIIYEIAENLKLHKQNPQTCLLDDMFHNMACKAAIRANDRNTPEEMKALVEQIFSDENIRHCPHGRPVMFTMTKGNIDHQFKRT